MSDTPRDPDLSNLLALFREVILDSIRTSQPGQIVAYDATLQRASIQPLIADIVKPEFGPDESVPQPVIHDAPVMFWGPARGRITWPVAIGDTCLIIHPSSAMSRWVSIGGTVDPGDTRRHDLSDAVALVGLHDFAHVPTDAPTDAVVIHASGGVKIRLGGSDATDAVVVQTALDDFVGVLSAVALSAGPTGGGPAITALKNALDALNTGTGWKARTSITKAK